MEGQVNRAKQLWENWERQEKQIERLAGVTNDTESLKYKHDFLSKGLHRLSINPSEDERLFMQAIKTVTAKLEKQLYPTRLDQWWYKFKTFIIDKPAHIEQFKQNKAENLSLLNTQFKTAGLHHLTDNLKGKLDYESPKVELKSLSGLRDNNKLEVSVDLEKDKLGSYRFNGFNLNLTNEHGEDRHLYISAESKITLTEAVNLLQGRSVFKSYENNDGSVSQRWIQLDKQQEVNGNAQLLIFPPNHEFDLKDTLLKSGIQLDFYTIAKESVRRGLEAGNKVEFQINGNGKYSITADPSTNTVQFFDANKNPINVTALKKIIHPVKQNKIKETNLIKQKDLNQDNQLSIVR